MIFTTGVAWFNPRRFGRAALPPTAVGRVGHIPTCVYRRPPVPVVQRVIVDSPRQRLSASKGTERSARDLSGGGVAPPWPTPSAPDPLMLVPTAFSYTLARPAPTRSVGPGRSARFCIVTCTLRRAGRGQQWIDEISRETASFVVSGQFADALELVDRQQVRERPQIGRAHV